MISLLADQRRPCKLWFISHMCPSTSHCRSEKFFQETHFYVLSACRFWPEDECHYIVDLPLEQQSEEHYELRQGWKVVHEEVMHAVARVICWRTFMHGCSPQHAARFAFINMIHMFLKYKVFNSTRITFRVMQPFLDLSRSRFPFKTFFVPVLSPRYNRYGKYMRECTQHLERAIHDVMQYVLAFYLHGFSSHVKHVLHPSSKCCGLPMRFLATNMWRLFDEFDGIIHLFTCFFVGA